MELDEIVTKINPENKLLARGREILEWGSEGKHRQSEAYAASLYLFLGGDPESALAALEYGIQENQRNIGPGLYREMPPSQKTYKVFEALKRNATEIASIVEEAYVLPDMYNQLRRAIDSKRDFKTIRREALKPFERMILGHAIFESAFNKGIRCDDCKYISDYLMNMPNVTKCVMELKEE